MQLRLSKKTLTSVPSSTVDFGTVKTSIFDQKATVQDFSVRIGETVKLSAQAIVLALKDDNIYLGCRFT